MHASPATVIPLADAVAPPGYAMMAVAGELGFAFVRDLTSVTIATCFAFVAAAVLQGMRPTLPPRVMPVERYGQFSAATSMAVESGMNLPAWLCGTMLDRFGGEALDLWLGGLSCVGVVASVWLDRHGQQLGGDAGDRPPPVGASAA